MDGTASVRDRILDTAAELFYREGVRAIGVDLIVERSRVAKASLYRHFGTKDDLVAAVLERADAEYWRDWDDRARAARSGAAGEIDSHLRWIAAYAVGPTYRGCPFLNVATEFPAPEHPARAVAARHKRELRRRLSALAAELGAGRPEALADQLMLLIDGAYVDGHLLGADGPVGALPAAGSALVAACR